MRKHLHPNIQDDLGYTLLHHATLNGHRETVSFLLKCGASTTIPDSSGECDQSNCLLINVLIHRELSITFSFLERRFRDCAFISNTGTITC